ncbi:hypothetical protein [uncultured Sphingomonas sp.]|uniref:hypothetical protein n=1 Tax=uncultured Sphingomonas sp. TaxID=158754 RepID=UPI0025F75C7C|nr:hypothetical protein [uncultured Sphingomonas sp.]
MAIALIKAVIVALVVAGLIFRTQQTIGLLALGGLLTLIANYPPVGFGIVTLLIVMAIIKAVKSKGDVSAIEDNSQK